MTTEQSGSAGESPSMGAFDDALRVIDRASGRASRALFDVGIYVMQPALVALVTFDVVLRYVFDSPLQWARDVSGLLLLMSIVSVLPHAWDRSYHIRMEVIYDHFSAQRKRAVDVISAAAGTVFFGMMTVQAARYIPFMIRTNETGEDLLWPLWPYMAFMAVCGAVTVARLIANPSGDPGGRGGHGAVPADPPETGGPGL